MRKSLLIGAFFGAVLVLAPVAAEAATSVDISNTGPRSRNRVRVGSDRTSRLQVRINNRTNTNVVVDTVQDSASGNVKVKGNTDAGDAESGAADNANGLIGDVVVANDNAGADCGCEGGDVTATIENTGPRSRNKIHVSRANRSVTIRNNTNVDVANTTDQIAVSGNATVKGNTTGGDAVSGDAVNDNLTDLVVDVANDNSGATDCGCEGGDVDVVIDTTGPRSQNTVVIGGSGGGVDVNNNTDIYVDNVTLQGAGSGNAKVKGNTTGGGATSGNATNTNSTSFSFGVNNTN